ncbi:MAG: lamin tail domain-containing protein [Phycisphaerae bacterium]|nr:lamin tail domain-containing protein [Phycisphaerae bacterium]
MHWTGPGPTIRHRRAGLRPGLTGIAGAWIWCAIAILGAEASAEAHAGPVINEVLAANAKGLKDPQGQFEDWIEIYNPLDRPINLAGCLLTDDLTEPARWEFPVDVPGLTTVPARGFLLVWADGDTASPGLHAAFSLDADGEQVGLFDAAGSMVDAVSFGPQVADCSFGRSPDGGPDLEFLAYPTPGAWNSAAFLGVVEDPVFSRARGFYGNRFPLALACPTPGALIRYTTDGSDPVTSLTAKVYDAQLTIDKTTCVRAAAVIEGWRPSRIVTHTYILGANAAIRSLPVISLVGDPGETFYEPNGVMAIQGGTYSGGIWQSGGKGTYNNMLDRDLERPVSFEWIDPLDGKGFGVDCGLRVHGSEYIRPRYTRPNRNGVWSGDGKISLRLYFRSRYGPDELEYPLFPFEVRTFETLVLRAGHNDRTNPFIKDELVRRLLKDMGHVSSGGTFANLFINGQYKGYFNPCERIDEAFCQTWFDSDQAWDVVAMFGDSRDGDLTRWNAFINRARQRNLADKTAYAEVTSQLDLEEFVDYLILRLWSGDWDWPQNNWSVACERSDQGRWRFFVWDAEGSFFSDRLYTVRFGELNSQDNENAYLYRALKANPYFRRLFGDRIYRHFYNGGALGAENVTRRFVEMQAQMAGVLPNMDTYVIDTWVPGRLPVFLSACTREGVYAHPGPTFLIHDEPQYGGPVQTWDLLSMATEVRGGTVYYTLDGEDPGAIWPGGGFGRAVLVGPVVRTHAVPSAGDLYTGPLPLGRSVVVRARVLRSGLLGALSQATFAVGPVAQTLRISEVMYHPQDTGDPNDPNAEYIELTNIGDQTINLNWVRFTDGVDFVFPAVDLAPGRFLVVAKDMETFQTRYGTGARVVGPYTGSLSNRGEQVEIQDATGTVIQRFEYADAWHPTTDGGGYSLTVVDPTHADPNALSGKALWRPSAVPGGSPGWDDSAQTLPADPAVPRG